MKVRAAILTLLLAVSLVWFQLEQRRGRFHEAEEWFLDFLVANAQDVFSKSTPGQSQDVVLVEFREEDRAEFSAWPPAPLDYIMVLKRLVENEPEVVAIVEPLRWENAETEFVTQLRNALVPFPSAVLGFETSTEGEDMTQELSDFVANEMPVVPGATGSTDRATSFSRIVRVPDWSLRIATQTGFSSVHGNSAASSTGAVPFVALLGKRLVPSLTAQCVTLFRHAPYAAQRLRFGAGARLSLGDELIVPLNADGTLTLKEKPRVPRVSALELMTPDLGDDAGKVMQATLGRRKLIVLSSQSAGVSHARAIATALAMPKIRRASPAFEWSFLAGACLLCLWQLRQGRMKAMITGFSVVVAGMIACLLIFQSTLTWWPPFAALAVTMVSTMFCCAWPHRMSIAVNTGAPAQAEGQGTGAG